MLKLKRWQSRWLWGLISWNSEREEGVFISPGAHRDDPTVHRDFVGLRLAMNKQQTGE